MAAEKEKTLLEKLKQESALAAAESARALELERQTKANVDKEKGTSI